MASAVVIHIPHSVDIAVEPAVMKEWSAGFCIVLQLYTFTAILERGKSLFACFQCFQLHLIMLLISLLETLEKKNSWKHFPSLYFSLP